MAQFNVRVVCKQPRCQAARLFRMQCTVVDERFTASLAKQRGVFGAVIWRSLRWQINRRVFDIIVARNRYIQDVVKTCLGFIGGTYIISKILCTSICILSEALCVQWLTHSGDEVSKWLCWPKSSACLVHYCIDVLLDHVDFMPCSDIASIAWWSYKRALTPNIKYSTLEHCKYL
jgi:hypothetical protein